MVTVWISAVETTLNILSCVQYRILERYAACQESLFVELKNMKLWSIYMWISVSESNSRMQQIA